MSIAEKRGIRTLYPKAFPACAAVSQSRLANPLKGDREEFFNTMFDCISEGILVAGYQGEIIEINCAAARLFGIKKERACGMGLDGLGMGTLWEKIREGKTAENLIFSIAGKRISVSVFPGTAYGEKAETVLMLRQEEAAARPEKAPHGVSSGRGMLAAKSLDDIIGHSPGLLNLKKKAVRYAGTESTVLITGESGVGKELFAQGIHNKSSRRNAPFVAINCAALPENLLESELFGYVRGAFTGARNEGKAGLFELADTGTIFLDEISETSPNVQSQLLRVLQERSVIRLGGNRIIPLNVRIIAATNRNLKEYVQKNRFRQDLYYRLCVLPLPIMPLRERREDILEIVYYMLWEKHRNSLRFSENAEQLLTGYDWPGNVRELSNFVERVLALWDKETMDEKEVRDLLFEDWEPSTEEEKLRIPGMDLEGIERIQILETLKECGWSRNRAAARLGMSTTTLWRRMKKLGILPAGET